MGRCRWFGWAAELQLPGCTGWERRGYQPNEGEEDDDDEEEELASMFFFPRYLCFIFRNPLSCCEITAVAARAGLKGGLNRRIREWRKGDVFKFTSGLWGDRVVRAPGRPSYKRERAGGSRPFCGNLCRRVDQGDAERNKQEMDSYLTAVMANLKIPSCTVTLQQLLKFLLAKV
ncbi:hypothetical protein chiPu_0020841 [Chiloscyllium punctatum]|uniref:Uncharacterized protein n=1 Tax=Chiloscyllium punctatum TaxID=137246 RepID=A0A401RKE1_CHIPU|nr:hypothetical protein [Chiloscyllium punctatum]